MKIKILNAIILAITICLCLSSCNTNTHVENDSDLETEYAHTSESVLENTPPLETYTAFVLDPGGYSGVKYNEPNNTYALLHRGRRTNKYNVPSKTIELGSDVMSMDYEYTFNIGYSYNQADSYRNAKSDVSVSYHENDGTLYSLQPWKYPLLIAEKSITDETYLFEICDAYVSKYVTELNCYTVSIGTSIERTTDHSYGGYYVEGFTLAPSDDEEFTYTAIYRVKYVFYVNGVQTEDFINISVTEDGCLDSIFINMTGRFNEYADYDIDMDRCDQIIEEEMSHLCNTDGSVLEGYDTTKLWAIINGQLCLIAIVTPTITDLNQTENNLNPHVDPTKILIAVSE